MEKENCCICGKPNSAHYRNIDNGLICNNCYRYLNKEICIDCGKLRPVSSRVDGKSVCKNCWSQRTKKICSGCNKLQVISFRAGDGSPLCSNCHRKQITGLCPECNKIKRLTSRNKDKELICGNCWTWGNIDTLYRRCKENGKSRNLTFLLTKEEFLNIINQNCHYCGGNYRVGIDRKDNKVGYELANCLPCCGVCNIMKGKMDYDSFIRQVSLITKNLVVNEKK
jgi:hypothetical protein